MQRRPTAQRSNPFLRKHATVFRSHSAPTQSTTNINNSHLNRRRRPQLGCQACVGGAPVFDWQVSAANYHEHLSAAFDLLTVTTLSPGKFPASVR